MAVGVGGPVATGTSREVTFVADSVLSGMHLPEARKALAEVMVEVLSAWKLSLDEQAALLGVSDVAPYHGGEPLPDDPAVLERAGELMAVERALRDFFAEQPELRGEWMRLPNRLLGDRSPLAVIRREPDGALKVRKVLEAGRVR